MRERIESPELAAFRQRVREWVRSEKPPRPDFILPQSFLEVETREQFEYLAAWQNKVYAAGFLGFDVPEIYGGRGIDPARQAIVTQELAVADAPFLINLIALQWVAPTLLVYGTEEQKKRLIPPLLSGDEIWCQGFSEPGAGSDLASLTARAEREGDGWVVTGHKVWTTLAHFAQWMILLARTSATGNKYEGLSYFLFPMNARGVTIEPLVKITGEGGFNQVIFDRAPMPASALLGREGEGWKVAMTTLMFERGAAQTSDRHRATQDAVLLEKVAQLARSARRDGRAAFDDAVIADRLAALWTRAEAMRLSTERAGIPGLCGDRPLALAMMHKLLFSEFNQDLMRAACEILGAEAMLWIDDPHAPDGAEWPRALLNSYGFTIGGGTSEVQRNILGERVLGLPKSK